MPYNGSKPFWCLGIYNWLVANFSKNCCGPFVFKVLPHQAHKIIVLLIIKQVLADKSIFPEPLFLFCIKIIIDQLANSSFQMQRTKVVDDTEVRRLIP